VYQQLLILLICGGDPQGEVSHAINLDCCFLSVIATGDLVSVNELQSSSMELNVDVGHMNSDVENIL